MSWPSTGRYSWARIIEETTWGTDPTGATIHLPILSETMKEEHVYEGRGTLAEGTSGSRVRKSHFLKEITCGGTIDFLVTYEGMGLLLKHILWAAATTTGAGPYLHVMKMATTPPTGGLTIEVVRGSGNATRYSGLRVTKATFKITANGILTLSCDFIGKSASAPAAAGTVTPSVSRELCALHHEGGSFTWNSATYQVTSVEWVVDNRLARRPLVGTAYTADPAPSDYAEVTTKVDLEWSSDAYFTAHAADTVADATFVFTDSAARTITFATHNAYVKSVGNPADTVGVLKQSVMLVGQDDGTDFGFAISLSNTQVTALLA